MYAIIETGGKQYRVEEGDVINVELLNTSGETVDFKNILLLNNGKETIVGSPYVNGNVKGQVVKETKGPKVESFKYKKRKSSKVTKGHRQKYSQVKINKIEAS